MDHCCTFIFSFAIAWPQTQELDVGLIFVKELGPTIIYSRDNLSK